jgi:hypothetical protein
MSHRQHTRNAVAHQQDNIFANDKRILIADADPALETFAARLAVTAYRVAVRHGAMGTWIDLELELWRALAATVETCVQESGGDSGQPRDASAPHRSVKVKGAKEP